MERIEAQVGGRLGVSIRDLQTGASFSHRGSERFPMASTFKAFACAHLLALADAGTIDPGRREPIRAGDLQTYSPVTRNHVGDGLSLSALCEATTRTSDNTAANLILTATGGPAALTAFLRSIGDDTTRLDRFEPDLNDVGPGDDRDTTSPDAAIASLQKLVLGDVLSANSRRQLESWLAANAVGGPLLRASLPEGWRIADRTGAGEYGTRGIIAVIWPKDDAAPAKGPILAAVYLTGTKLSIDQRNGVIAELGAAMVEDLGG
ncbi:hypothetical protein ASG43_11875 [Aureimonas sp. Leaf454]|nr:hypothetical protein ASG43_11875 [Aureimonas sp. Leaf454]